MSDLTERQSAEWFRQQADKLGCDNWRGPARLREAAARIQSLEAAFQTIAAKIKPGNLKWGGIDIGEVARQALSPTGEK